MNNKEENFLLSGFRPRIRPLGDVLIAVVTKTKAILSCNVAQAAYYLYCCKKDSGNIPLLCNSDRVLSLLV